MWQKMTNFSRLIKGMRRNKDKPDEPLVYQGGSSVIFRFFSNGPGARSLPARTDILPSNPSTLAYLHTCRRAAGLRGDGETSLVIKWTA